MEIDAKSNGVIRALRQLKMDFRMRGIYATEIERAIDHVRREANLIITLRQEIDRLKASQREMITRLYDGSK